jgi:hypothetical protein
MSVFDDSLLLSPLRRGYRNLKWKVQAAQARCVDLNCFGALVPITAHLDVWLILGITGLLLTFFLMTYIEINVVRSLSVIVI